MICDGYQNYLNYTLPKEEAEEKQNSNLKENSKKTVHDYRLDSNGVKFFSILRDLKSRYVSNHFLSKQKIKESQMESQVGAFSEIKFSWNLQTDA